MMNAEFFINHLKLQSHPEGGYFKETYRAGESISADSLPTRFNRSRNFSTAIYYLLQRGDFSAFHRIKSDECSHFYAGETLLIHVIENDGKYYCIKLGTNLHEGETFQFIVPSMAWFAAEPSGDSLFSLAGCTVAPGFDFADFELADREILIAAFPQHSNVIAHLCRK